MTTTPDALAAAVELVRIREAAIRDAEAAHRASEGDVLAAQDDAHNARHRLAEAVAAREARAYDVSQARLLHHSARVEMLALVSGDGVE